MDEISVMLALCVEIGLIACFAMYLMHKAYKADNLKLRKQYRNSRSELINYYKDIEKAPSSGNSDKGQEK